MLYISRLCLWSYAGREYNLPSDHQKLARVMTWVMFLTYLLDSEC